MICLDYHSCPRRELKSVCVAYPCCEFSCSTCLRVVWLSGKVVPWFQGPLEHRKGLYCYFYSPRCHHQLVRRPHQTDSRRAGQTRLWTDAVRNSLREKHMWRSCRLLDRIVFGMGYLSQETLQRKNAQRGVTVSFRGPECLCQWFEIACNNNHNFERDFVIKILHSPVGRCLHTTKNQTMI